MEETIEEKQPKKIDLGNGKISKLMMKFAIPCIISLLVNSLYNIVDQIFIGQSVGYLGNAATNVVFPISVAALSIALLIGDGGAAFLSLKLGQKEKEAACSGVVSAIIMAVVTGVVYTGIMAGLLPYALKLFGATDTVMPFALEYGWITVVGLPFVIIGTALNSIIRADGSPAYAMISMIIGAVINVVLDAIFILALNMGMTGAALATILGQIVTFIISCLYIFRFKSIRIRKKDIRFTWKNASRVLRLGISSFITQISIVFVISVNNNLVAYYGSLSKYGADIPLSAMGIVMKVNQVIISIVVGTAVGAQPIIGYNYGAGNLRRVKKAYGIALSAATIICIIGFIFFQFFPQTVVNIFGSEDGLYNEFACKCFQMFLMLMPINGVQITAGIFFQAIGKPLWAAILSLSRQIAFLIPAMFLLPLALGLDGVLYAGPVADGMAFLLACTLLFLVLRNFKRIEKKQQLQAEPNPAEPSPKPEHDTQSEA